MNNTIKIILGPIVGGLSHEGACLWGRADGPAMLHAWLAEKEDWSDAKPTGTSELLPQNGFAGVVPIHNLKPETIYYYTLTLTPQERPATFYSFKTAPMPGERRSFRFAFGSCFRPELINPGRAFVELEKVRLAEDLQFILMIGDQIYADQWDYNSLNRVAVSKDDYRQVYQHTWSKEPFRNLLKNLPVYMTLDDHEVDDDWHWLDVNRRWAHIPITDVLIRMLQGFGPESWNLPIHRVRDALQVYWEHQGMHAPLMLLPPRLNFASQYELRPHDPGSLAYTFYHGAAAFFVMDTRTMRVRSRGYNTILGEGQWQALEDWLMAVKDTYPVKFIISSAAMLFNLFGDVARDRWSGFPNERERLLKFLAENAIEGVHVLAGDLHSGHATSARLLAPNKSITIWESCSSPFEQNPNPLSKMFHYRVRSRAIKNHTYHFIRQHINFGVVDVRFDSTGTPRVQFYLHYEDDDGKWKVDSAGEGEKAGN